jgi:predicted dehydrogenase
MRSIITIRLESGLLASVSAVGNSGYTGRRIYSRYEGSRGTAEVSGWPLTFKWATSDRNESHTEEELPPVASPVADWLDCMETGAQPLGTAEHGALVTRMLAAVYESARSGRSIRLEAN